MTLTKLSNKQIASSFLFLNAFCAVDLPPRIGFSLGKLKNKLVPVLQSFEAGQRKLVEKYGEKDKDGKLVEGENGAVKLLGDGAQKDLEELMNATTEIEVPQIKLADLKTSDGKDIPLSGNLFAALDWLIVE
jgi:hypothetical protein